MKYMQTNGKTKKKEFQNLEPISQGDIWAGSLYELNKFI